MSDTARKGLYSVYLNSRLIATGTKREAVFAVHVIVSRTKAGKAAVLKGPHTYALTLGKDAFLR